MKNLMLVTFLFFFFIGPKSHAQNAQESVNSIKVENLSAYNGMYLSAFYVIGSKPLISTSDRQISVSEIKLTNASQAIQSNEVIFPKVTLQAVGFRPSFNFILFVLHRQKDFVWVNVDGNIPTDPRGLSPNAGNTVSVKVLGLSSSDYRKLMSQQGNPDVLSVRL